MRHKNFGVAVATTILGMLTLFGIKPAQAQQIVPVQIYWNVEPGNGALYLNICSEPGVNGDRRTGLCANINVLNSNVTREREFRRGTSKNTNLRGSSYGISGVSGSSGSQYGN